MATVTKLLDYGNSFAVLFSDGSHVLADPVSTELFIVHPNSNHVTYLQRYGNQYKILYDDESFDLTFPTPNPKHHIVNGHSIGGSEWRWPLDYHSGIHVTQEFDNGVNHTGIDISYSGIIGDNIYAIADSVVNNKGFTSTNGNAIKLQAFDGSFYEFYHMLNPTSLNIGDSVSISTVVGYADTTGSNALGPHCHFGTSEIGWPGLNATFSDMENPRTFMSSRGAPYPW